MAVQRTIPYSKILELIDQLTKEEKRDLVEHLQEQAEQRELTTEEWVALFKSAVIDVPISDDFSFDRADWYDDDVR